MSTLRNQTIAKAWRDAAVQLIEQAHRLHETAADLERRAHKFLALAETMEKPLGSELHAVHEETSS